VSEEMIFWAKRG